MPSTRSQPSTDAPLAREAGLQVDDLIDALRWPLILKSTRVGLRPAAIGMSLALIVLLALIDRIPRIWREADGPITDLVGLTGGGIARLASGIFSLDAPSIGVGASLMVRIPSRLLELHAWSLLLLIPAALVTAVLGGAICRMAACDLSRRQSIAWPAALGFAVARWASFLGVLVGPALVVGGLALALSLAGMVLLGVPYLNIVGGILYVGLLALGALGVAAGVGYALGSPMLLPAVACEGADAVDSMGRTFPYAVSKPIRLVAYLVLLVLVVWASSSITHWAASSVSHFTKEAAAGWAGPTARHGVDVALGLAPAVAAGDTPTIDGSWQYAAPLVGFWNRVLMATANAVGVSIFFAASTAVYLLMRWCVDGQDPAEIWSPGEIEDTMARTQASRKASANVSPGVERSDPPPAADE
jgi:hypothetical protein